MDVPLPPPLAPIRRLRFDSIWRVAVLVLLAAILLLEWRTRVREIDALERITEALSVKVKDVEQRLDDIQASLDTVDEHLDTILGAMESESQ